jgi:GTP cyclohydrolase II
MVSSLPINASQSTQGLAGAGPRPKRLRHIALTSHPGTMGQEAIPIHWGAPDPLVRGPIVATVSNPAHRNVIGTHAGGYAVYRALAVASGDLQRNHRPDFTNTAPAIEIGPYPSWCNPHQIVSLDPLGALVDQTYQPLFQQGFDIRPTIAITKAHIQMPELQNAVLQGWLEEDGVIMKPGGELVVTKAAIEPVWYLPGIAARLKVDEEELRYALFEQTGGMFPELVTRPDLKVFLPPIGSITVYIVGDITAIRDPHRPLAVRVHDECNGSDVFGSDICTCRPYLVHGLETCVETAQAGGVGVIVYLRKEGRALGEVTKFLVYNARKRQAEGDNAAAYFARTECVAGVNDVRFQELMPDVLHWLGITRIDKFVSMSNLKHDAVVKSGIEIVERVPLPEDLIPNDAWVEIEAKKAAGYFSHNQALDATALARTKGRRLL